MPVCEQCGVTFEEPKAAAGEVVSLRILCPTCAEERRRRKLAAAGTSAASRSGPARPASTAPVSARPPLAARTSTSLVRPAAARSPPAAPATAGKAAGSSSVSGSAKDLERLRKETRRAAALQRAHEIAAGGEAKPLLDKATRIGLFAALGIAVIVVGVLLFVVNKKATEKEVAEKRAAQRATFIADMRAFNLEDPTDCAKVKLKATDNKELWAGTELDTEVKTIIARAESFLESNREKGEFLQRLADYESQLRSADTMTAQQLLDLRRNVEGVFASSPQYGEDVEARARTAKAQADRAYLISLREEARTFAKEHPDDLPAVLNKYAAAEIEIRVQYENAMKNKDKDAARLLESDYKDVLAAQDPLCAQLFTDAYVATVPWRDLLAPAEAGNWIKTDGLQGFQWSIENGRLHARGPVPEARKQAAMSIGDKEKWRDFVMEIQFKVSSGAPNLFFRLGLIADTNTPTLTLEGLPEEEGPGIIFGKTYTVTVSIIGSTYSIASDNEDDVSPRAEQLIWSRARRGAFGIGLPADSELDITRLRVKLLRR